MSHSIKGVVEKMIDETNIIELIEKIDMSKKLDLKGSEMIADVLEGMSVVVLPLIFWKSPRDENIKRTYNYNEQFYSKEKMLYCQLEAIAECAESAFGAPLCIRPNFGTIYIPAMLGLEYLVFKDAYPWLKTHMDKNEINK